MHATLVPDAHAALAHTLTATCIVAVVSAVPKLSPLTVTLCVVENGRFALAVSLTTGAAWRQLDGVDGSDPAQ